MGHFSSFLRRFLGIFHKNFVPKSKRDFKVVAFRELSTFTNLFSLSAQSECYAVSCRFKNTIFNSSPITRGDPLSFFHFLAVFKGKFTPKSSKSQFLVKNASFRSVKLIFDQNYFQLKFCTVKNVQKWHFSP